MSCTFVWVSCWWIYHGNIKNSTWGHQECGIHFRSVLANKGKRLLIDIIHQIFRWLWWKKYCGYWPDFWYSQKMWSEKVFKCQQQLLQGWSSSDWSYFVSLNKCICRAQNNGRLPDNVRPRWLFVRTKFGFGGHFDRSSTRFPNN